MSKPTDDWRHQAACLDVDPEIFYPDRDHDTTDQALALCEQCPVRDACLTTELAIEGRTAAAYRYGIRGGELPKGRAHIAKRGKKLASGNASTVKQLLDAAEAAGHTSTDVALAASMRWGTLEKIAAGTQSRCQHRTLDKVREAVARLGVAA